MSGATVHLLVPLRGRRVAALALALSSVGAVLLVVGALLGDEGQLLRSYLAAWAYVVSLAVGALIFLCITHVMNATWPIAVRRVIEAVVAPLPLLLPLSAPILLRLDRLYPWASPSLTPEQQAALAPRAAWLDPRWFILRAVLVLSLWAILALLLHRWSRRQDERDLTGSARPRTLAAVALPLLGLTLTLAAFDWLMSLDPTWWSTMYGVYYFAGGFLGALALITCLAFSLVPGLGPSHAYALGRLLLAFVIFWAYAAYFQLFLIWIADLPVEVGWYAARLAGPWRSVSAVLALGHFVLPFALLLSYPLKRRPRALVAVGAWLLAMHYLDVLWLVKPPSRPPLHWLDAAALAAIGGAAVAFAAWRLDGRSALPLADPGCERALAYASR